MLFRQRDSFCTDVSFSGPKAQQATSEDRYWTDVTYSSPMETLVFPQPFSWGKGYPCQAFCREGLQPV
jgi:hypothetical protein